MELIIVCMLGVLTAGALAVENSDNIGLPPEIWSFTAGEVWSYNCSCTTEPINMCYHHVGNDYSQRIDRHPDVLASITPCDGDSTSLSATFYNTTVGVIFYWCTFSEVCSNFQEYNSTRAILVHVTEQPNISSLQAIPQLITIQEGEQYVYTHDCHYLVEDQELKMCYYRDGYDVPQPQFIDRFLQENTTDVILVAGQCPNATLSATITGTNRTSEVLFWFTTSSSCNLVENSGPRPIRIIVEPKPPLPPASSSSNSDIPAPSMTSYPTSTPTVAGSKGDSLGDGAIGGISVAIVFGIVVFLLAIVTAVIIWLKYGRHPRGINPGGTVESGGTTVTDT